MPTEPVAVQPPKHPTHALTTYELRDYRRELENALKTVPVHAGARELLRTKLAEVLAEQEARIKISGVRARLFDEPGELFTPPCICGTLPSPSKQGDA